MKILEKKQIETLVKRFNEENNDSERTYVVETRKKHDNDYQMLIFYNRLFYSRNMNELMKFCIEHDLMVRLSVHTTNGKVLSFLAIQ